LLWRRTKKNRNKREDEKKGEKRRKRARSKEKTNLLLWTTIPLRVLEWVM
jgi:hypothetical protein